jgi:hypothetical protein
MAHDYRMALGVARIFEKCDGVDMSPKLGKGR